MATNDGSYTTAEVVLANSGTSFAAPHVAGVAALMLSECSVVSRSRMKSVIMGTVDYVSALSSYCVSGGRLNAYKALSYVHSYTHTYMNASYHTSTCACGTTKTLAHYFIAMGHRQMCADCGYMT
ncbi:MAG: S8 family serine peptidase [Oscillospiraceae bacterium]|nr:S8 family serine peptidase [Oscillospiraceae bacterium]